MNKSVPNSILTLTENGAQALSTTLNANLDLFATIGGLRERKEEAICMFEKALKEDKETAIRLMFYTRDIRGYGIGERDLFRVLLKELAQLHPFEVIANLNLVPKYGRWDDLFCLLQGNSPIEVENKVLAFLKYTLKVDSKSDNPTLLAKWMPSINTSSEESVELAKYIANKFGWMPVQYRKTLSKIRKKLDVVERKLSANQVDQIVYSSVPSQAMLKYKNAFCRKDAFRFINYLGQVRKGSAKMNTGTLYPYQLIEKLGYKDKEELEVIETLWKQLPDYTNGKEVDVLVMPDVSGSMMGRPMHTSIGLAIYFAERNKGAFKNQILSFDGDPQIITLNPNDTLYDKYYEVSTEGGTNTDVEKAFDAILKAAILGKCTQKDLPNMLLIISDMEFDQIEMGSSLTFYEVMKNRYSEHGYKLPKLVFWNVDSRNNVFHAFSDDKDVVLVSGHSINTFKSIFAFATSTPEVFMNETLSQYSDVIVRKK